MKKHLTLENNVHSHAIIFNHFIQKKKASKIRVLM